MNEGADEVSSSELGSLARMRIERAPRSASAVGVGCVGFLLVSAYAIVGMLQILVWNPMAAVPGLTLPQIYRGAAQANETIQVGVVVTLLAPGIALGLGSLVLACQRGATWVQSAAVACCLLFLGGLPYFWASFGVGMNVADAHGASGGDHTGWDSVIWATSGYAGLALVILAVGASLRSIVTALRAGRRAAQSP